MSYQAGWSELYSGATKTWDALFELAAKLGVTADTFTAPGNSHPHGLVLRPTPTTDPIGNGLRPRWMCVMV
jgi:hypothetical protein